MKENEIINRFNMNAIEHQSIMDKLEGFSEKLTEVQISIAELPDELTRRFDERYASKDTETSLKRIMWIVISAVIISLLALVIKG